MYPDGFEDLEDTEKGPKRTYVSSMNQQDSDKLLRENERLKKSLEKEKFFNKLLDQELKDLKSGAQIPAPASAYDYHHADSVSKRAFMLVLFLAIGMAGFIGYTLLYNKQYNLFTSSRSASLPASATIQQPVTAPEVSQDNSLGEFSSGTTPRQEEARRKRQAALAPNGDNESTPKANDNFRDSVPEIIGRNTNPAPPAAKKKAAPVTAAKDDGYNEAEVEAELNEPVTKAPQQRPAAKRANPAPPPANNTARNNSPSTAVPPPVQEEKTVVGKYKVLEKANFYSAPNEGTQRSVFIRGDSDKVLEALKEENGFVYVVYTNDLGYTSRGWLSKKDLTPAE